MQRQPGDEITFEGTVNFRELGGYPTADGRTVRHGLFYRSGNLDALQTESDRKKFLTLGIKTVLDLRSAGEAACHPDPALPGVEQLRICAMRNPDGSEMDFSPAGIEKLQQAKAEFQHSLGRSVSDYEWFTTLYCHMPFENPAYHALFAILEEGRVPILFHCSAGKDRTGIAAMLILLALGADRETALADYMLTNTYRAQIIARSVEGLSAEEAAEQTAVEGVSRAMAEATLDGILQRCGSYEAFFLQEFGLDAAKLTDLRRKYTI